MYILVQFVSISTQNDKANGECLVCGKEKAELRGKLDQVNTSRIYKIISDK